MQLYFLSSMYNLKRQETRYALRVAKAEPTRLQGVQKGDAEVLFQARFNEAHGHPANAGAVFERIA
jgi:hypothetical protein